MINPYEVWFSNVEISNKLKLKLLKKFEKCEDIWNLKKSDLLKNEIDEKNIDLILDKNILII